MIIVRNLTHRLTILFAAFLLCTVAALSYAPTASATAGAQVTYQATGIHIRPQEGVDVTVTLTNTGNLPAIVDQIGIGVYMTDEDGEEWEAGTVFLGADNVIVPPGATVEHTYFLKEENTPPPDSVVSWRAEINEIEG